MNLAKKAQKKAYKSYILCIKASFYKGFFGYFCKILKKFWRLQKKGCYDTYLLINELKEEEEEEEEEVYIYNKKIKAILYYTSFYFLRQGVYLFGAE